MIEIAKSQLGVKEATGRNDGVPAQRFMRGDQLPWCAGFVLWVYEEAGIPLPGNFWKNRAVNTLFKTMRQSGMEVRVPAIGGLVFFSRDHNQAGPTGHVEIVIGVEKGAIRTIGGNVANAVRRGFYYMNDIRITGYADPFAVGGDEK